MKTQPTTAYIITEDASADTNTLIGSINETETDTTQDGPSTTGATFINFVASTNGFNQGSVAGVGSVLTDWDEIEDYVKSIRSPMSQSFQKRSLWL